jgi:ketosteroid isomerase-like protein
MTRTLPLHFTFLAASAIAAAIVWAAVGVSAPTPAWAAEGESNAELGRQVREAEIAFAKTMADRDHDAFASHVAEEAVFFSGPSVLRGRAAVAAGWAGLYEGPTAPFSWEPEQVEVLDSGTLALSTGPVFDPGGKRVGTFISTWRREADGVWRVIFDKGCPPCEAPPQP